MAQQKKKREEKALEDWGRVNTRQGAIKALSFSCVSTAKISATILAFEVDFAEINVICVETLYDFQLFFSTLTFRQFSAFTSLSLCFFP